MPFSASSSAATFVRPYDGAPFPGVVLLTFRTHHLVINQSLARGRAIIVVVLELPVKSYGSHLGPLNLVHLAASFIFNPPK